MISVCIASYNGEKYIGKQIESIVEQLGGDDELIVSDDGSTDATREVVASFADSRIKLIDHSSHRPKRVKYAFEYVTHNFDYALRHTRGDLIFLADQDDVWHSDKIHDTIDAFRREGCLLMLHDCRLIDNVGEVINDSYFRSNKSARGIVRNIIKCSYLGCCMAFDRRLLGKALPMPDASVPHDIWLGLLAEYYGKVYFHHDTLIDYRRHDTNTSSAANVSQFSLVDKVAYRAAIVSSLLKRVFFDKNKFFEEQKS